MRVRVLSVLMALMMSGAAVTATYAADAEIKVTDVRQLAGTWRGVGQAGSSPANGMDVVIDESGKAQNVVRPAGTQTTITGSGEFKIEDGKLLYESQTSKLEYTLREKNGKRVLSGEGRVKPDGRKAWTELTEVK